MNHSITAQRGICPPTSKLVALGAFLAAGVLLLAAPVVSAAPDELEPPEEEGYDTPQQAAEAFFDAVKEDDYDAMRSTLVPEVREGFDQLGPSWVEAIEVTEVRVDRVEEPEENVAHLYYEWDAEVDMSEVADDFAEIMVESLRDQGLTEEEIETFIDLQMEVIRRQLERQAELMEREEQRMILVRIEERWYVDVPADEMYEPNDVDEKEAEVDDEVEEEEVPEEEGDEDLDE